MLNLIFYLIFFAPLTATPNTPHIPASDIQLNDLELGQQLIGTWISQEAFDHYDLYGEKTYLEDGTAYGFIHIFEATTEHKKKLIEKKEFKSKWKVQKGVLVIYDVSYHPYLQVEKEPILDKFIKIEKNKILYADMKSGDSFWRYRKINTSNDNL